MRRSAFLTRLGCTTLLTVLTGTTGFALEKLQATSHAAAAQQAEFDILLPITHRAELNQLLEAQQTPGSWQYHNWITPQQFQQRFGPNKADVARITALLQNQGLEVLQTHSHGLRVRGAVTDIENTFATSIWNAKTKTGASKMISKGPLVLPQALTDAGAQIVHFSPVIRNRVHSKNVGLLDPKLVNPDNRYSPTGPYWFTDLKQAYDFPSNKVLTGKGVKVGIVMDSDYSLSDMTLYFGHENLAPPQITRRPVFGGAPYDPVKNGDTFEVSLDIQQVGGMAPGATIYLYNIPDLSDQSIIAGYITLIERNEVDIVNSSFGGFEAQYFPEYNDGQDYTGILQVYDDIFKQGNAQGITFVASSGDEGALGKPPVEYITTPPTKPPTITGYFLPGVDTPAASPYVTAVGGTNLVTTFDPTNQSLDSKYVRENADGDPLQPHDPYGFGNNIGGGYWGSGGGISEYYAKPDYQKLVKTGSAKYRTVPDVSLHMGGCPAGISYTPCGPDRSAVVAIVGGNGYGLIGTSASAPDFAGLLALLEEFKPGRIGNANYLIYQRAQDQFAGTSPVQYFHEGIPGFNGYYQTKRKGYDLVLGNGTVDGKNFIGAAALPSAGTPQTPSNP